MMQEKFCKVTAPLGLYQEDSPESLQVSGDRGTERLQADRQPLGQHHRRSPRPCGHPWAEHTAHDSTGRTDTYTEWSPGQATLTSPTSAY